MRGRKGRQRGRRVSRGYTVALGLRVRVKNQPAHWRPEATVDGESGAVPFKMSTREPIVIYPLLLRIRVAHTGP